MQLSRNWLVAAAFAALGGASQAALVDRGGGLIYDSTLNLTWLADMNYAQTSGYLGGGGGGSLSWDDAVAWADGLVYAGFNDWRLPTVNTSDATCSLSFSPGGGFSDQHYGFNCAGGELSHLFVTDLGNKAGQSVLNQTGDSAEQIANLALFSNVQSSGYWSGTEYAPYPTQAWMFFAVVGNQTYIAMKSNVLYAVAVRPGDVAAPVPEPHMLALVLLGLGVVSGAARRQRR